MTPAELYADVRLRISDLVRDLPAERLRTVVPGCPEWTVHDVVAHATGIVADMNAGKIDGAATDEWTCAQVDLRRDTPTAEVLDEWAREAATFEPRLNELPKAISRATIIDVVTHEHDVRGALGVPGGTDSEAYEIARKAFAVGLAKVLEERGLPGLRLEAPDWQFDAGQEPRHTVRAPGSYEFFRGLAGRRGLPQVLAWEWETDPEPYLPLVNHFGPLPENAVAEAGAPQPA